MDGGDKQLKSKGCGHKCQIISTSFIKFFLNFMSIFIPSSIIYENIYIALKKLKLLWP